MFYVNKRDERLGEKRISNQGLLMEIIEYNNIYDCTVKFEETNGVEYIAKHVDYHKFKNGSVKNLFATSSYGVGYIGNTTTKENGKPKLSFSKWQDMMKRCPLKNVHPLIMEYGFVRIAHILLILILRDIQLTFCKL